MRGAGFRVLAGLLALGFGFVLLFGDTSKLSGRERIGIVVIGFGFGVYAIFGASLLQKLVLFLTNRRDSGQGKEPPKVDKPH
jgi:hypothetical protein